MTPGVVPGALVDRYADAPLFDRFHVKGRLRTCPLDRVAEAVPTEGRILDFGCGHGVFTLYLALDAPTRELTGVDLDEDKIMLARLAADAPPRVVVDFVSDLDAWTEVAWDAIVVLDVLYLLDTQTRRRTLDRLVAGLAPGGKLVIKEIDLRPRWKYALAWTQEQVATRVMSITEGARVDFLPPDTLQQELEARGLGVESQSIDRGYAYPHHLIVGRRPESAT